MDLLNSFLSSVDATKRSIKRNLIDAFTNPQDWGNMQSARIEEDRYGSPEGRAAVKASLAGKPYDKQALARADAAQQKQMIEQGGNAVGMFVGKGSSIWDAVKASEAKARLAKGESPASVWKDTGYGIAPDGAMKTEIDDSKSIWEKSHPVSYMSEMNPMRNAKTSEQAESMAKEYNAMLNQVRMFNSADGKIGNAFLHNDLYQVVPDAQKIRLEFKNIKDGGLLGASYGNGLIEMGLGNLGESKRARDSILHELQHHIQDTSEGFAKGGSPAEMVEFLKKNPQYGTDPKAAYKNLYGEAEARLTESRSNLNKQQRLEKYPFSDMEFYSGSGGTSLDDLIFKYK